MLIDPTEDTDTDGDEIGNNTDTDDDGDGISDVDELAVGTDPLDTDTDGDGASDDIDEYPLDETEQRDTDQDGIPDNQDTDDDDEDGIPDNEDAFPLDATESLDTDGDGVGNNADEDDDGDGYNDSVEIELGTDTLDPSSIPLDQDRDFIPDAFDQDKNGDGFIDAEVFISEVLTPNTNGFENHWKVVNIEQYTASKVTVYDRNGQRVFEKQNYQNDWDGVYQKNGELLPVGSYYYRIDLGDGTPIFDGWIYLTY